MAEDGLVFKIRDGDDRTFTYDDEFTRKISNSLMNDVSYSFESSNSTKDADIPDTGGSFDGTDIGIEGADFIF